MEVPMNPTLKTLALAGFLLVLLLTFAACTEKGNNPDSAFGELSFKNAQVYLDSVDGEPFTEDGIVKAYCWLNGNDMNTRYTLDSVGTIQNGKLTLELGDLSGTEFENCLTGFSEKTRENVPLSNPNARMFEAEFYLTTLDSVEYSLLFDATARDWGTQFYYFDSPLQMAGNFRNSYDFPFTVDYDFVRGWNLAYWHHTGTEEEDNRATTLTTNSSGAPAFRWVAE
jgi:hypothetical protein